MKPTRNGDETVMPGAANEAAEKRGKARAEALSPQKRRAIAKKGARARWRSAREGPNRAPETFTVSGAY